MMSVYDKYTGDEQPFQVSLRRIYTNKEKAQAVCNRLLRETCIYRQREYDKYLWTETNPKRKAIKDEIRDLNYKKVEYYDLNKESEYSIEMSYLWDKLHKCTIDLDKEWEVTNKLSYELNKLEQKYYVEEVTLILDNHNNG